MVSSEQANAIRAAEAAGAGGSAPLWRYVAREDRGSGDERRGEIAAATAAEARASLRRVGLQIIELQALEIPTVTDNTWERGTRGLGFRGMSTRWLRGRRQLLRSELFDSLATLIQSGVPLAEAVDVLCDAHARQAAPQRRMLVAVRERLRGGASFADALAAHADWFDPAIVAMVRAAQRSGTLPTVLREMAERQARTDAVTRRLAGVMIYPATVSIVALAVVVFLSQRTLPELAKLLSDAKIEVPLLTRSVIVIGNTIVTWWPVMLVALVGAALAIPAFLRSVRQRRGDAADRVLRRLVPAVLRRIALGRSLSQLAQMLRADVKVVEALRVVAPTVRGLSSDLGRAFEATAERIEQGQDIATALGAEDFWFDAELRRMVAVGEASGELEAILERVGDRQERAAHRAVDRLASLLEPAIILGLATLVGIVALAAVLPLVRLQQLV